MTISEIIATISLVFALVSFVLSLLTNTKKYELQSAIRSELLEWYSTTLECLIKLKELTFANENNLLQKADMLAKLSTQIEIGRFYFPNIITDSYGSHKPMAYQGLRNFILELLVFSYDIFKMQNPLLYINHAIELQRLFTSEMVKIISPYDYNKRVKRYTGIKVSSNLTLEDFLRTDPNAASNYFSQYSSLFN